MPKMHPQKDIKPPEASQDSASFLRRLAGPSIMKAGYVPASREDCMGLTAIGRLAKDQTDINRIIAEASKGSKFYEVRALNHGETR